MDGYEDEEEADVERKLMVSEGGSCKDDGVLGAPG